VHSIWVRDRDGDREGHLSHRLVRASPASLYGPGGDRLHPQSKVVGLSKMKRLMDALTMKPTMQELITHRAAASWRSISSRME
jgi:hypothetical protein